jgi:hypothetical protein
MHVLFFHLKKLMEPPFSEYLVLLKNRVTFSYSFIFHSLIFLKLNNAVSAKRTAQISVFNAFSYKNASRNGARFSNKFHRNKLFNIEITKNGQ